MPRRTSTPKHRAARVLGARLRQGLALTVAVAALAAVGLVSLLHHTVADERGAAAALAAVEQAPQGDDSITARVLASRAAQARASRSDRRDAVDTTKRTLLQAEARSGDQVVRTAQLSQPEPEPEPSAPVTTGDPRAIASSMLGQYGWGQDQFGCLDALWQKESGWNYQAANPSSGAYGIPQALPGSKMASAGADWQTNPATQIAWGLGYIQGRYGTPCGAWGHSQSVGWY